MDPESVLARYHRLEEALASLIPPVRFSKEVNMKLERMTHLLEILGNPQQTFAAIHVGGTSGKGSTSTMIAAILTAAGYRTGLYLSPHLQVLNECYQINNRMAAVTDLAEIFETIKPAIAQVGAENPFGRPSYFETQTALAFCLFRRRQVDVAVVEVGLGGALDATNLLPAQIAVLTNVGLDHTEILGDTVERIAQHKAGIIKPGQIVISGVTEPAPQSVIARRCAEQGATLWQSGADFAFGPRENGESLRAVFPDRRYEGICLGLRGEFQASNALCALAAVHAYTHGVADAVVRDGLCRAAIPGRMEVVQNNPTVLLDGAHNPDKMRAAAAAVATYFPHQRRIVILALKSDKAFREILPFVLADCSLLIVTAFGPTELWEAAKPEILAAAASAIAPGLEIRTQPDPMQALAHALAAAGPDDLIWVTGSLYLIGDIREYWYPSDELLLHAEQTTD